jgi:hypothetical protein
MTGMCLVHPPILEPCPKCGIARVRAALQAAPRPPAHRPDPAGRHAAAINRARAERADKDTQP